MMCFRRLVVEGDSLSAIKNIKKKEEDKSVLRPIAHYIHQLELLFDEVTYNFVPRAVNDAAHVLAQEGQKRRVCGNWVKGVPNSVRIMVVKDRLVWNQRI
ncbi:hypothetical protein Gogos_001309 [Gossypium gossypioides]|uniref:RNase H type-1 domain-containing protein n=1 Tax=Gossypium gossypioides TaxID=34282 RepID=A0A7J9CVH6_GOSGO|nr:hypothetical protein [Gossypium gossypioides]